MEVSWNAIAWNRNTGRVLGYEVRLWVSLPLVLRPPKRGSWSAGPSCHPVLGAGVSV